MHLTANKKLEDYKGNYATYVKTREEKEVNQLKEYEKQQEEIRHIKKFIASCGTFANAVKQAQSRQKVLYLICLLFVPCILYLDPRVPDTSDTHTHTHTSAVDGR